MFQIRRRFKENEKLVYYQDILANFNYKSPVIIRAPNFVYSGAYSPLQIDIKKNIVVPNEISKHLELVEQNRESNFPKEIVENIIRNKYKVPRISTFKISGVKIKERVALEIDLIKRGVVKVYNKDYLLYKLCRSDNFTKKDLLKNGRPNHETVLPYILKNDGKSFAIEIPIWKRFSDSFLTGYIDLLRKNEDNKIQICDYKPKSFFHSIPQVCVYSIVLKEMTNIENSTCVMFNEDGAWEFKPEQKFL
ncbi:hypothetical protein ES706_05398 [subsurface metagenome]